jgi:hypothetical protein
MGNIANIVLNDAATTPVAHTFGPSKQGMTVTGTSIAEYEDRAANGGIPVGFNKVSLALNRPNKERKTYRLDWKVETPVLEVTSNSTISGIAPAPTIAYLPLAQGTFVLPERSSLQSRKDLRKMTYELFGSAAFVAAVEALDFPL